MKPWQAAAMGWGYMMAAYAGSLVLGRDFFTAMTVSGAVGTFVGMLVAMRRDFER